MAVDVWVHREDRTRLGPELEGFRVEASNGPGGKVSHVSFGRTFMVIERGPILRRSRRVVPAAAVEAVDTGDRLVRVGLTRDELLEAPAYDARRGLDEKSEAQVEEYYSRVLTA